MSRWSVVLGEVTGLPFPANAEIVLEGFCYGDRQKAEGPFGEWTGFYSSSVRESPVMEVKAIYHRNDPIILGSPPQRPPDEHSRYLAIVRSAQLKDSIKRSGVPDVQSVWCHEVGGSRMFTGVSIKQKYPGHATQAGFIAAQCGVGAFAGKYVVVVDDDIDVTDLEQLLWVDVLSLRSGDERPDHPRHVFDEARSFDPTLEKGCRRHDELSGDHQRLPALPLEGRVSDGQRPQSRTPEASSGKMGPSLKVVRQPGSRIVLAFVALLCFPVVNAAAQTESFLTVRVASSADDAVTPILYAQREGLFRRAGLDVVLQKANSGSAVAAAVISGSTDIGKSSLLPLVSAHARGIRFVLVGGAVLHTASSPDVGLIAAANGTARSARDLDGQVVSVPGLNDVLWVATRSWIDAKGGDSSTVRFIELPGSSVTAALEQGRIVAGALTEPYMTSAAASGRARVLGDVLDGISNRLLESVWFTNVDFAAKNRDAVARFARALRQASLYCNEHQNETIDLAAAFTGIDPSTFRQMHRPIFATALEPKDMQPLIDAAAKYKVIPAAFAARELNVR